MIVRYAAFTVLLFMFSGIAAAAPYPTTMPYPRVVGEQVHGVARYQVHRVHHRGHVARVRHIVAAYPIQVASTVQVVPSPPMESKNAATETLPIVNQRRVNEDHVEKSLESVQISTREPEMETVAAFAPKAFMWFGVLAFVYMVGKHGLGYVVQQVMAAGALVKADFTALEARVRQIERQFEGQPVTSSGASTATNVTGAQAPVIPAPGSPPA